jgi:CBS domain-containing protein
MEKSGSRQLAVVEENDRTKLIGILTMSDIVRAHARAAMDAENYDRPELPALSGQRLN